MNLNYSDEQNMLREQVLKFCETNYDFIDREKILETEAGYSQDNWKQFAELGWLAVPFKEENGGFNFGPIELTVLFEEFGKALVVEPYLIQIGFLARTPRGRLLTDLGKKYIDSKNDNF